MGDSTHHSDQPNSVSASQSAHASDALARIRAALHTGGDARALFDALDRPAARYVAESLTGTGGGAR